MTYEFLCKMVILTEAISAYKISPIGTRNAKFVYILIHLNYEKLIIINAKLYISELIQ